MEKEPQPDSLSAVTIKPDYPPSEAYSSEPPPAYHRSQSSSVQVAKIIGATIVLVSFVLGSFILASAYITANASCRQLEEELEFLSEAADRFQGAPLHPEALIQDEPIQKKEQVDPLQIEESKNKKNIIDSNQIGEDSLSSSSESDDSDEKQQQIHFKLPLQLDFDDLAGALIEKNQKSRMNCVVEKKRAEEIVDHQPKTVQLPFGLNLTTDPRYEKISGERMAIFCESGKMQRQEPGQQQDEVNDNDDSEDDEEAVIIQPIMIPIPPSNYQTHMAQQMRPIPIQSQPMDSMRPPQNSQFPPSTILHQIAQQIITQKIMEAQRARADSAAQEQQVTNNNNQQEDDMMVQRLSIPEQILTQLNRLPNRDNVIVAVQQEPEENNGVQQEDARELRIPERLRLIPQGMVPAQMQVVQQPRDNPSDVNGRQTYTSFPIRMMPQRVEQEQINEEKPAVPQKLQPQYQQSRSKRSVDALLPKEQKRVKRCSCNCAC